MKKSIISLLSAIIMLVAWPDTLLSHQDTIIRVDGITLVGLPEKYAPAELDPKTCRLRIGKHAVTFPPLLRSFFDNPYDLRLSASWYHERSILPPYLSVKIQPRNKDFSYSILLNLETLDVIGVSVTLQESDSSSRGLPIALSDQDKDDLRKSIQTFP